MKGLKTAGVVAGIAALLGGRHKKGESGDLRNRRYERALAIVTGTVMVMSLMVLVASPALAHHPILDVSAACDDQGNRVVTWTLANGNWEGRTMTVSQVQYSDGIAGWSSIVVGLTLAPDASITETVVYDLSDTGTKTLTITSGWSDGGPQGVSASLSVKLDKLKCDHSTTTTKPDEDTTTTEYEETTTTAAEETSTTMGTTTTTATTTTTTTIPPDDNINPEETTSTVGDEVLGTDITTSTVADEVSGLEVLPFTGSNDVALVTLAASAIALGATLLVAARREED